jgi:hypothetical protein
MNYLTGRLYILSMDRDFVIFTLWISELLTLSLFLITLRMVNNISKKFDETKRYLAEVKAAEERRLLQTLRGHRDELMEQPKTPERDG